MMVNKKIVTVSIICNLLLWGSMPFSMGQAASISKDEKAKIKEEIAEQIKYVVEYRARERKLEAERKAREDAERMERKAREDAERRAKEAVFNQKYNALLPVLKRCGIVYGERNLLKTINADLASNRYRVNEKGSYTQPQVDYVMNVGWDTYMIGVLWRGRKFYALAGRGNSYDVLGLVIMRTDGWFEVYLPNKQCLVYDWNWLQCFAEGGFIIEYSDDWDMAERMQEIANAIAEYDS